MPSDNILEFRNLSTGRTIVAGEIGQKSARLGWRFGGCCPATIVPGNNCAGASLFPVSVASCAQAFRRRTLLEGLNRELPMRRCLYNATYKPGAILCADDFVDEDAFY